MSISTKRGDDGSTDLMFGRRVSKTDIRVGACGAIDELNAAMGVARVSGPKEVTRQALEEIQGELIVVMGELMTLEEDRERYFNEGYKSTTTESVDRITAQVMELETLAEGRRAGWATPGASASVASAQLDMCRTVCRRAERAVAGVAEQKLLTNPEIFFYLNRLSDLFWLLARAEE